MTRGQGKHRPQRTPAIAPDTPEARELGLSDRMQGAPSPIPGGETHIVNAPTHRQPTPVPDAVPEVGALNAHGVAPGTATTRDRADMEQGPNLQRGPAARHDRPRTKPVPVPVYLVEGDDASASWRSSAPRHTTIPPAGSDPVRICGRDPDRHQILLLNEAAADGIRFAQKPGDLNSGGGALLPAPMASYLKMVTQDELWAVSNTSNPAALSSIQEFDTTGTTIAPAD